MTAMRFVLVPGAALLAGLEAWGSGWCFGPSWTARALAGAWIVSAALACARIGTALEDAAGEPPSLLVRSGLVAWVCVTAGLLWCAFPAPIAERVDALCRTRRPDPRTFRTVAVEALAGAEGRGPARPDPASLLALAAHRRTVLDEPASGLAFAALAPRGALRFWSTQEVWGHVEPLLRQEPEGGDAATRFSRFELALWSRLAGDGAAQRALVDLAQRNDAAAWESPEYHATAARALAELGQGPDAALEHELAGRLADGKGAVATSPVEPRLLELARRHFEESRKARSRLQEVVAADLGCEAWLTDTRAIPAEDQVSRLNVESLLQDRLRALELRPTASALAQAVAGREEDQLAAWNRARRAVLLARGLHLAGRRNEARRVLARVTGAALDPYRAWVAERLARSWGPR